MLQPRLSHSMRARPYEDPIRANDTHRAGSRTRHRSLHADGPTSGRIAVDGDPPNVCLMVEHLADRVKVPDVLGLPFHVDRDIAAEAGVTLANSDADGPLIAALTWPGLSYIT